jgi:hypothetical protein
VVCSVRTSAPETGRACVRRALALRFSAAASDDRPLVLPVGGGAAGLLGAQRRRRLVSLLDPRGLQPGGHGLRAWLERRQARHSALILVPDRATGMHFTGRWGLDLARIRAVPDLSKPPAELIQRCLGDSASRSGPQKPWHSV